VTIIYKIVTHREWTLFSDTGLFSGSAVDFKDGFIHFSHANQLAETARRHFSHQPDLVLFAVRAQSLGAALRFEPSRGGALFPHLHAALALDAVIWHQPLAPDAEGVPIIPPLPA